MLTRAMFCHTCGAKNPDDSRFCNMCGTPFVRESSPLDSTQVGVGGAFADAARSAIAAERARESAASPPAQAAPAPMHTTLPVVAPDALPARPSVSGSVDAAAATVLSAQLGPPPVAPVPPLSITASGSVPRPSPAGLGDPSISIRLDSIGIQSARKTWMILVGGGLLLLLAGVAITYVAMRSDEPARGTAHEGDPFEIGTPTADVDFVSGSNDAQHPVAPITADAGAPAPATRPSSAVQPTTGAAGTTHPVNSPHPIPPVPTSVPPTTTGTTTVVPTVAPTGTTGTTTTTAPVDPNAPTPEMELEMYSARVRYLVRRYYAGRAQTCFDQATADNPSLSGQVVVAFHVGSDGHVTSTRTARNTTGSEALGACLAQQAQHWELSPPPSGEVDLTMPFSR